MPDTQQATVQYIALKELDLGNGRTARPGDEVPEAAGWSWAWFQQGHVAMCPAGMAEELRRTLAAGNTHLLNNHPLGQHHLHVAAAAAQQQSSARGGEVDGSQPGGDGDTPQAEAPLLEDAPPLDPGPVPVGKERITADGGQPINTTADVVINEVTTADEDADGGEDVLAESEATSPSAPASVDDGARTRRRRPRRRG